MIQMSNLEFIIDVNLYTTIGFILGISIYHLFILFLFNNPELLVNLRTMFEKESFKENKLQDKNKKKK